MLKKSALPSNELSRIIEGPKGAEQSDAQSSPAMHKPDKLSNSVLGKHRESDQENLDHRATGGIEDGDENECLDYDKHRFLDESELLN